MPLVDINGHIIVSNLDFPNNHDVMNIEIGAGTSYFGKKYFPLCYLTDLSYPDVPHFESVDDYENSKVHYLDYSGDFFGMKIDRKFNRIIFCNPYKFGLQSEYSSRLFLNKIGDLLNDGGAAMIVGNHSNGWAKYRNANRMLGRLSESGDLNYQFELSDLMKIDENHDYRKNMVFRRMINNEPTEVDEFYYFVKTVRNED